MRDVLIEILWYYLSDLGNITEKLFTQEDIKNKSSILDMYDEWLKESLRLLVKEKYLAFDGYRYQSISRKASSIEELKESWCLEKSKWEKDENLKAQAILLEHTIWNLEKVLTGKNIPAQYMFPNSSVELVGNVYKNNVVASYFNNMLADCVYEYIKELISEDTDKKIRIFEIGAGTGATTSSVLSKIRSIGDYIEEYCYTDVSKAFLNHAEEKYGKDNSFLTYKIFNVEDKSNIENSDIGKYDIVIAANVLHTTMNIRATLNNTKLLLKKNGLLILNEITRNSIINHLTFGLLEGWWSYNDKDIRIEGFPGLHPSTWKEILELEGFYPVVFPAEEAGDLGQQIIMTESNGIISLGKAEEKDDQEEVKEVENNNNPPQNNTEKVKSKAEYEVEKIILRELAKILRMNERKISRKYSFSNYGLDSIIAVNLTRKLNEILQIDLEITTLFEYNTLEKLTEYIESYYKNNGNYIELPEESFQEKKIGKESIMNDAVHEEKREVRKEKNIDLEENIDSIAIVGLDGTFPMAENVEDFWENMKEGKNCITKLPMERDDWKEFDTKEKRQFYDLDSKCGGFIDDVYRFDPLFFGISPSEANIMSPEERLLLMSIWKTIENAGITPEEMSKDSTGVFLAIGLSDYQLRNVYPKMLNKEEGFSLQSTSIIPNRISYILNLKGPSEYCESTCSSALVAIHRAVQAIKEGECSQALVGGVNLILSPGAYISLENMNLLSPTGKARSFQKTADGFVIGEGVGSILIKSLKRAKEDNDNIYGIIKSSAVIHGGSGLSLYTPNIVGMKDAIARVYKKANIGTETVSYIETHGVASSISDSIEFSALKAGYNENIEAKKNHNKCYIGSIKPCVGHLEVASGIAALIKVILGMKYNTVPKLADFDELNSELSLENSFLDIPKENVEWPKLFDNDGNILPKRAAIHGFGIGGVNAHIILEEYVPKITRKNNSFIINEEIVILSAKTEEQLLEKLEQLLNFLNEPEEYFLNEIAFTLQVGRMSMEKKVAFICRSIDDLKEKIIDYIITYRCNGDLEKLENSYTNMNDNEDNSFINLITQDSLKKYFYNNNSKQIAYLWVKGLVIDWKVYYDRIERKVQLPAYPFSKEKYYIHSKYDERKNDNKELTSVDEISKPNNDESVLVDEICKTLGLNKKELDYNKSLHYYGLNSILSVELLRRLQKRYPDCTLKQIIELDTVRNFIRFFCMQSNKEDVIEGYFNEDYPELIKLNEAANGIPIFWIHAASGGVEIFTYVAQRANRPFYGIQAKGYMTKEKPLNGIVNIATYYIEMIRSIQAKGPYDLGGYCIGGVISYEIAKQLQKLGEKVNSIVMIDSPDPLVLKKASTFSNKMIKSVDFQFTNMLLWPKQQEDIKKITASLINCNEIDSDIGDKEFCERLIELIKQKGLNISKEKLLILLEQNHSMQEGFNFSEYRIEKLENSKGVECFYFRNSSMLFYGEIEPYMKIEGDEFSLDYINYFDIWKKQFERFHMIDVNDTNHMMMLTDRLSRKKISEKCMEIYNTNL